MGVPHFRMLAGFGLADRVEMAGEAIARGLDRIHAAALVFVDRFFDGRHIRGVDFCLCAIAAGWVWAASRNAEVMSRLAHVGLSFVTRDIVLLIFSGLAVGHLVGFLNPHLRTFRGFVLLVSALVWLIIGAFNTWAVTTGGVTYLIASLVAFMAIIYLQRSRG